MDLSVQVKKESAAELTDSIGLGVADSFGAGGRGFSNSQFN